MPGRPASGMGALLQESAPLPDFLICCVHQVDNSVLNHPLKSRTLTIFYYAFALCVVLALMIAASALRSKPVEVTITVDSDRAKPQPIAPVPLATELPVADRDIETAGDHLAAAVIYLQRRQNDPALNALEQARAATERALTKKPAESKAREQLLATDRAIETVRELIRKGKLGSATKELKDVNQQLEQVSY